MGFDATLVGGAGDQGVDLVLRKGAEVIAVQCKNLGQPVGNRPVQEVYAGARHHGVDQAWVVAPAGYTRGALDLARSTGVVLYARADIEDLVRQAESRRVASAVLKDIDRESYQTFLRIYSDLLDSSERLYLVSAHHVQEIFRIAEVKEQYERTRYSLYRYIYGLLQDLTALEERNPELRADDLFASRRQLEVRQQKIEQRAKEQGVFAAPANVQNLSVDPFNKQAIKASSTPSEISTEPTTTAKDTLAKRGYAVGDTAILKAGDRVTLHSFEAPVPPQGHKEVKAGYELSVLDVEVCAGSDPEGCLDYVEPYDFTLQMPDNTRLEAEKRYVERELQSTDLLPSDAVRGQIFFQKRRGEKPKSVIFTSRTRDRQIIKWTI